MFKCAAIFVFVALVFATAAPAQDYPSRPITIVVPQPPGGGTDIIARVVGQQLSEQMGVPVVIQNRPGAGFVVGTQAVANAAPDGYTLLVGVTGSMAVNPSLFKNLGYDPIRDFTPIGMWSQIPLVLVVGKNFPAHSVKELIDRAKAKPHSINFASSGNGSGQHLSGEMLQVITGAEMTYVPYRGSSLAYPDIIAGYSPMFMIDSMGSALAQIEGGSVTALAVTSKERSPLLPNVPTMIEAGVPGYESTIWFGLWAPKKTPQEIIKKLYAENEKAISTPRIMEKIEKDGGQPMHMPLQDIEPFVKQDIAKWRDFIQRANVSVVQ